MRLSAVRQSGIHGAMRRRGVTLIETVIGMLILSSSFVAVLSAVSSSRGTYVVTNERAVGRALAEDLLSEILLQHYAEPDTSLLGIDVGESLGPGRSRYDDLDDYHSWSASPPADADGSARSAYTGYTRSASVQWVSPTSPDVVVNRDEGCKRIVVTVQRGDRVIAELTAYRTSAWAAPGED